MLCGAGFYHPPARVIRDGRAGHVGRQRAGGAPGSWHTLVVVYRSRSVRGKRTAMSASIALPNTPPSCATVVFDHVTTGAADRCAPTRVARDNTERERMTRADTLVDRLLSLGI